MWLDSSGFGGRVLAKTGAYSSPRLSPDRERLALTSQWKVWIYDLAQEKTTALTLGLLPYQCCPVWSPDGDYVAFWSNTGLTWSRWDGGGTVERLAAAGDSAVPFSFSPVGKWLAFHQNGPQTDADIWAAPVVRTGGVMRLGPPRALIRQVGMQTAPAISPDGRWLAYSSNDETGRMEIYVIPLSPEVPRREGKWQVSTDGGAEPKWSPKGDEIYFRTMDGYLMAVAVDGKGNTFHGKPRLWCAKRMADVGPTFAYDVAPDGRRILALFDAGGTEPDRTHLRILLNVDAELGRQWANRPKTADSRR